VTDVAIQNNSAIKLIPILKNPSKTNKTITASTYKKHAEKNDWKV